jgi:N-acetylglucosamine-6-phosphate deacetylase
VKLGGLSLPDAMRTATVNPARVIRLDGRMRGFEAGESGDIVAFLMKDADLEIESVWLNGIRVV